MPLPWEDEGVIWVRPAEFSSILTSCQFWVPQFVNQASVCNVHMVEKWYPMHLYISASFTQHVNPLEIQGTLSLWSVLAFSCKYVHWLFSTTEFYWFSLLFVFHMVLPERVKSSHGYVDFLLKKSRCSVLMVNSSAFSTFFCLQNQNSEYSIDEVACDLI